MTLFSVIAVRKKVPQLTVVPVQTTNIPPKEVVTYTKQTQTTNSGHDVRDGKPCNVTTASIIVYLLYSFKLFKLNNHFC